MLSPLLRNAEVLFSDELGIHPLTIERYPSGEPLIKEKAAPWNILLRPSTMETFWAVMMWVDALIERGNTPPELVLPFVPGARQDRLNTEGDQLFTAKSIARAINDRQFPVVHVLDPHSTVITALIDRCRVIDHYGMGSPPFHQSAKGMLTGVISPDAGADKRAEAAAKILGCPVFHAGKHRDLETGAITGFWCQPLPEDGLFLIVDDICDGGGTFVGLVKEITQYNPRMVNLFTTHGLYTKGADVVTKIFNRVFCTDSTVGEKTGVVVSQVATRYFQQLTEPNILSN